MTVKKTATAMALVLTVSLLIPSAVSAESGADNPTLEAVTTAKTEVYSGGSVETAYLTVYKIDSEQTKSTTSKLKPKSKLKGKSAAAEVADEVTKEVIACPVAPEHPIETPDNDPIVFSSDWTLTPIDMQAINDNVDDYNTRVDNRYDSMTLAGSDADGDPDGSVTESITVTNIVGLSLEKIRIELGDGTYKIVDAVVYEITDGSQIIPASADKNASFCSYTYEYDAQKNTYSTTTISDFPRLETLGVRYTSSDIGQLTQFGIYSKDTNRLKGSMVGTFMFLRIVPT